MWSQNFEKNSSFGPKFTLKKQFFKSQFYSGFTLVFGFQQLFCISFLSLGQKTLKYWDKTVLKMWSQNIQKDAKWP